MSLFTNFRRIIRQNLKLYGILSLVYYGLVIIWMIAVSHNPAWEQALRNGIRANVNAQLMQAYADRSLLIAILLTFIHNFVLASLVAISLPSLLIPYWGVLLGAVRAVLCGLALSPSDPSYGTKLIPHSLTGLLEGQGYILAMLGVYLLWRNFFHPHQAAQTTPWGGYLVGLQQAGFLYSGVLVFLLIAAIYEAVVAIYLIPILV